MQYKITLDLQFKNVNTVPQLMSSTFSLAIPISGLAAKNNRRKMSLGVRQR